MAAGDGMLGRTAKSIPFLNHNQGPRISYYCSMAKQAMGDTGPHQLLYCQRPMVRPCHEVTEGCNVILAINCMGYNQEDALVASKGALERGLFRSIHWSTYHASGSCGHLAAGQQVAAGAEIMPGVFTAKRGAASSTITEAAEAEDAVRITTGAMRTPVRGDKLCSRHGQKGVIGMIVPDEDMPFTAEGIRPDLVINAHAFPSRMTVGQIMEMAGGKISGDMDGRAFGGQTVEDLYARGGSGRETMYSGTTGLPLRDKIFIAPCWYQRLHHLAQEKCYARGKTGLTDRVTNQPTAGRKNSGGMRLGEMERDVLLGSGATQVMRERMDCIGQVPWETCRLCGKHLCQHIYSAKDRVATVPHATQLLAMELAAMGIRMEME
jgi:DNA-directed RNA polymerase beta subunit